MRFLGLIAAVGKNLVIGSDNDLLWHLPKDFQFFKNVTKERVVIMGRNTYNSMGKALVHRYNFVLSSRPSYKLEDAKTFTALSEALDEAYKIDDTPFIIGGAQIYKQYLDQASHLFLTHVDFEEAGQAYFPKYDTSLFSVIKSREFLPDEKHKYGFVINVLQRNNWTATDKEASALKQLLENL